MIPTFCVHLIVNVRLEAKVTLPSPTQKKRKQVIGQKLYPQKARAQHSISIVDSAHPNSPNSAEKFPQMLLLLVNEIVPLNFSSSE